MPTHKGVGKRIEGLIFRLTSQTGERVTLAEFGRLVAKAEGRKTAYTGGAVSQWIGETNEPKLRTFVAMGVVTKTHPTYVAFGDAPLADGGVYDRSEDSTATGSGERPATPLRRVAEGKPRR